MISNILILIVLIGINAFFAASEIALISLNDNKIKQMADNGDKKAKQLVKLLGKPTRFLATIQIGITLAGFFASAFAAESFANPFVESLVEKGISVPENILMVASVFVITIVLAYFTLVFGELVPKRIAMNKSEGIAFFVVTPLTVLSKIVSPFVKLLTSSTNFFVRIFGIDPDSDENNVTEEEIRMMVDVGEEKGSIHEHEKIMINNIFEFNNKTVEDIMTHRTEVVSIPVTANLPEVLHVVEEEKYTRIPVYDKKIDNIIGILYTKDLLSLINNGEMVQNFVLEKYVRKPFFVPIHRKINEVFVDLQMARTHMAVVTDEYGGTEGIITMEDLMEEIVGKIFDEYDEEETLIQEIEKNIYEVSGLTGLDELEEAFQVEMPVAEYDTLSGFLIGMLGHIPSEGHGQEIVFKGLRIQIVEVSEKRIEKVLIHLDPALEK